MDNNPDNVDNSSKVDNPIEVIIKEYKTAFLRDRYLDGFGSFLTIDAVGNAKETARENAEHDDKYASEPILDTELGPRYFTSLANIDEEMMMVGHANNYSTFSKITKYIEDIVSIDFGKIKYSASSYLLDSEEFHHAWFDDMLRAGLRGLRKTNCELSDIPVHYRAKVGQTSISETDNHSKDLKNIVAGEFKKNSRFRKLTLAGLAGFYVLAAASGIGLVCLYDWAGSRFKDKEKEWETKIDEKIDYRTDLAYLHAEKTINDKLNSFINTYAPDIGKDLPLEKRLPLVFDMLKEDAKNELLQIFVKEGMPIFEARYGPPISEEKIVQNVIAAIKSGEITWADLMQLPKEKK